MGLPDRRARAQIAIELLQVTTCALGGSLLGTIQEKKRPFSMPSSCLLSLSYLFVFYIDYVFRLY